jgi:hypothetical protein
MEWVEWMWRGSVHCDVWGYLSCVRGDSQFIAKGEMDMRCRGVGGEEVGVKCGCIQGCCECARPGMLSWWRMMQVAVSTKTNRFGAAARQWQVSPPRAHYDRGWESHPVVFNWERGHGGCWSEGSRGGYGKGKW